MSIELVPPQLKYLKKVTVKIICKDDADCEEGTGFISGDGSNTYVLTCLHVIRKKSNGLCFENQNIDITLVYNNVPYKLSVKEIRKDEVGDKDFALLKVEMPAEIDYDYANNVRFLKDDVGRTVAMGGIAAGKTEISRFEFVNKSDNEWMFKGTPITNQNIDAQAYWSGYSGGGLFYQENGRDVLYAVAYFKGLVDGTGDYNEFNAFPITNFIEVWPEKGVDEIPVESIVKEVVVASQNFLPLKDSLLAGDQEFEHFIESEKTKVIIKELRNDDNDTIQLVGLSGLGKTRLLYEAFNTGIDIPNAFYCKYDGDTNLLYSQLVQILTRHKEETGLMIVDDCPLEYFPTLVDARNSHNNQFRLIGTNHDFFDVIDDKRWLIIGIEPKDMQFEVDSYIEEQLHPTDQNRTEVQEIKQMAEGYPQMALELLKHYQEGVPANTDTVEFIVRKLLKFDTEKERIQETIIQTLSLCQPMPYANSQRDAYEYMLKSDKFTPLYNGVSFEERRDIAESLINKYKPTLIELQGSWLNVRPFPLAVWLTKKWFEGCNKYRFSELIQEVAQLPEGDQKIISTGFCKHIEQMHGNKAAFELVGKLVNTDDADKAPFLNEEVLCSGMGSEFFLAMSAVNPAAVAKCLAHLIVPKSTEWLRSNLTKTARRNIVWALEKLCFAKESYNDAVNVMAKLAVAENEDHIGNNATGQLKQLFHVQLAGTEVSLYDRIETLNHMILYGEDYISLTIDCLSSALVDGGFTRMCGAEKFGGFKRVDYTPSGKEVIEYWKACRDLLIHCVENYPIYIEKVAEIVERSTYRWVSFSRLYLLEPLLEKISSVKADNWQKEYEELRKSKRRNKDSESDFVEAWIKRLRPQSFLTDLKEARYEMWDNYRSDKDYTPELARELFNPLVEKFVTANLYNNKEELKRLVNDNEYIDTIFCVLLRETLDKDVTTELFHSLLEIVLPMGDGFRSSFIDSICFAYKETAYLETFLQGLKENGYRESYIRLMAYTDSESLPHLDELQQIYSAEKEFDMLPIYLDGFQSMDVRKYNSLIVKLRGLYPEKANLLLNFIIKKHLFFNLSDFESTIEIVKSLALDYNLSAEEKDHNIFEYASFVASILEKIHDVDFAKSINCKMISYFKDSYRGHNGSEIFEVLLKHYPEDVWDDFMEAFLSEDGYLFMWQLKDTIGSGSGFGEGVLYQVKNSYDKLKALCVKYPETAPHRIAETAPCYKYQQDQDGKVSKVSFSDIFIWLLDNFGDQDSVRSGIHANLGTFSWTGSTVPYYRDNIMCYEQLLEHKIPEVRKWAALCIESEKKLMNAELDREAYMRIHYGMNN